MRKNIAKFAAVGLSLALVVTSVNLPSNTASAAAKKAKLSATKKTITAKKSATLKLKKKKGGATIKLKSSYVKVSTSKKSVATIKAVKKNKKVVSYKVSAKKAGKATITIKVKKGTYKGTYKCKVTVKAAPKVTPKPTAKPTAAPTKAPATEAPATEAPTEAPATEAPTEAPATEAPTEEPTATPAAVKATVESASTITNDGKNLFVTLTLKEQVTAADLKDAKITLKGAKTVTATFKELNADGKAVFVIDDAAALKPGDTSANGEYTITSDSLTVENVKTDYEEALAGNAIAGYVVKAGTTEGVKNAKVSVEGGQSVTTDANGFYRLPATNGKKKVTVEAEGFLDNNNGGTRIDVNRNHVTSQNFQMQAFDATQIEVAITAADGAAKVEGATVTVKRKSDGKVLSGTTSAAGQTTTLTASSTGLTKFGNSGSTVSADANNMKGAVGSELFAKGETYVVSVVKKLSSSNLTDVYAEQTAEFTIGNKYIHEVTVNMKKVAKTPSMTIKQTWDAADNTAMADDTDNTLMKAKYQVYTTVNGSLEEILPIMASDVSNKISANATDTDLIAVTGGMANATLPTGNYYVVITPKGNSAAAAASTPAVAVVKVAVTEGTAASATVKMTDGYTRQFSTNVALKSDELKPQDVANATAGDALAVVKKGVSGYDKHASATVAVDYKIAQIMDDGVEIPVKTVADVDVALTANNTFAAASEFAQLLSYGKYKITSAGDYMKAVDKEESISSYQNRSIQYDSYGTWNLEKAEVKVTADSDLVGRTNTAISLVKFEVKNAADGKVVASQDLSVANTTGTSTLAADDVLTFAIPADKMINAEPGDYIVEYTLKDTTNNVDFKAVASASTKMIGLEAATVQTTAKVVKATADAAQISGKISVKKDDGTYEADANLATATSKALVVLLDANKKIAGVSKVDASGLYSIVDGGDSGSNKIVGGNYTLVFRMDGAETVAKSVKIDANEKVAFDIQSEQGGNGVIKAHVQDTQLNALNNYYSSPIAYDEYYVMPDAANFVSGVANATTVLATTNGSEASTGYGIYNLGLYVSSFAKDGTTKIAEWTGLSAGKYSVHMGVWTPNEAVGWNWLEGDASAYKFKTESVILKGNGDKAYPEWEYEKVSAGGSGKVKVTVNFDAAIATSTHTYAIVAENEDGTVETQGIYTGDGSATSQVIQVTSNKTYTIKLYSMTGNQVASTSVNVQRIDTSVKMVTNPANAD